MTSEKPTASDDQPAVKTADSNIQTICLVVIATAVVTYLIYWLRPVLVPFVVALFVVSGITPLLETLENRLRVNRLVASAITFIAGVILFCILGVCLWLSVLQLSERGQAYRDRVGILLTRASDWLDFSATASLPTTALTERENPAATVTEQADAPLAPASTPAVIKQDQQTFVALRTSIDTLLREGVSRLSIELFNLVTTSIVVLIYVFFILAGSVDTDNAYGAFRDIDKQVRSYLALKTIISLATGAAFGFVLWIAGVPMALTFGVLAFLMNYIPNVGPILASLLPIPFIVLDPSGSVPWMISTIAVTCTVQVMSGNVVEPKLMGQSSDLHPVVILLALMFWGMLWGITGMFLATPITAAIKIVLDQIDAAKPVSNLLAGRWGTASK